MGKEFIAFSPMSFVQCKNRNLFTLGLTSDREFGVGVVVGIVVEP